VNKVRSVHGLASFCQTVVNDFSSIALSFTELVKKNVVSWESDVHDQAFSTLKEKLTNTCLLCMPNFEKGFVLESYAYGIGIVKWGRLKLSYL
jgi:hypothetical protein